MDTREQRDRAGLAKAAVRHTAGERWLISRAPRKAVDVALAKRLGTASPVARLVAEEVRRG
jgi:hypothetical protein